MQLIEDALAELLLPAKNIWKWFHGQHDPTCVPHRSSVGRMKSSLTCSLGLGAMKLTSLGPKNKNKASVCTISILS